MLQNVTAERVSGGGCVNGIQLRPAVGADGERQTDVFAGTAGIDSGGGAVVVRCMLAYDSMYGIDKGIAVFSHYFQRKIAGKVQRRCFLRRGCGFGGQGLVTGHGRIVICLCAQWLRTWQYSMVSAVERCSPEQEEARRRGDSGGL